MTSIGMNLSAVNYYGTGAPFIDRFRTAGAGAALWGAGTNSKWGVNVPIVTDERGLPEGVPAGADYLFTTVQLDPVSLSMTDRYVLTWEGTATFQLPNTRIVSAEPGRIVFDFTDTTNNFANVLIRSISSGDPLHDLHIFRADQEALFNEGKTFNPAFLEKANDWDVLRFMDWGNTNASATVDWATRPTDESVSWASSASGGGVPLEIMIRLANEAKTDMWWNVPTQADDTYVRGALALIREQLDPDLKVHVEYSNEMWNWSFLASRYSLNKANQLWGKDVNGDGKVDPNNPQENVAGNWMVHYGYRSAQVAAMARAEFAGEDSDRVVTMLAGQAAGVSLQNYVVQGVGRANVGATRDLFDNYSITTYFGGNIAGTNASDKGIILGWARNGAAGMDAAFRELEHGGALQHNESLAGIRRYYQAAKWFADQHGLELTAYEGGAHMTPIGFTGGEQWEVMNFISRLMNDERMGDLYAKMVDGFEAAGGKQVVAFQDAAPNKTGGYWGLLDHIYQDGSPRYDGLLSARPVRPVLPGFDSVASQNETPMGANPPAVSDGEVTTDQREYTMAEQAISLSFTGAGDFTGAGNALANYITGGAGANNLAGGAGDDTLVGNAASDFLSGGEGDDLLRAMAGHDRIIGGAGGDIIDGGDGNDHLFGQSATGGEDGADWIFGGAGGDYIQGNAGADTLDGGDGFDRIQGGQDGDLIFGGAGQDSINGNLGDDTIDGGLDNDFLRGGQGNDILFGGQGHDVLMGDRGNDTLVGGAGEDALIGGDGADLFVFGAEDLLGGERLLGDVLDFSSSEGDRVDFSALDAAPTGGDDAFRFIGGNAFSRSAGELRMTAEGGDRWRLAGDLDGDGVADFSVTVTSRTGSLQAADLVL